MSQAVAGTPVTKSASGAAPDPIQDFVRSAAVHIRRTELFYGWMIWLTGLLLALTAFVLIDHWFWEFNRFTRLAVFGGLVLWSVWWFVRKIVPPMLFPINPEHAARLIERQLPDTKDSLISWLQLNRTDATPPKSVLNQIGRYAFRFIKNADSTQVADTANLIRLSAAFFGGLLCVAVYLFVSPKSGWTSATRLLLPWANIEPATRVQFTQITPGATTVMQGSSLPLDVMLRGLHKREKVQLRYDLSDGQVQGEIIPLHEEVQGVHYKLDFGKSFGGIHQPLTYWITAGDATAGPFKVDIQVVPLVAIDQIQLDFPPYTQLKSRTLVQQGQIEVPEGTVASFSALANQEMQKARIEFDPILQGKTLLSVGETVEMKVEGSKLSASWVATVDAKSRKKRDSNYRIKATNTLNESNHDPVIYPVKVIPDLPPEAEFGSGIVGPIDIPIDQEVMLEVLATDPDYGLSRVDLYGLTENRLRPNEPKELFQANLMEASEDEPLKKSLEYALNPGELGVKVGDVFDVVVEAKDNYHIPGTQRKEPQVGRSSPLRIRIVEGTQTTPEGASETGLENRIANKDAVGSGNQASTREKIDWNKVPQNDPRHAGKGNRTERSNQPGNQGADSNTAQDSQQSQGPGLGSGGESGTKGGANKEGQRNNSGNSNSKSGASRESSGNPQDGGEVSGDSGQQEMNQGGSSSEGSRNGQSSRGNADPKGSGNPKQGKANEGGASEGQRASEGQGASDATGSEAGSEQGESLSDDRNAFNRIQEFMKDKSKGTESGAGSRERSEGSAAKDRSATRGATSKNDTLNSTASDSTASDSAASDGASSDDSYEGSAANSNAAEGSAAEKSDAQNAGQKRGDGSKGEGTDNSREEMDRSENSENLGKKSTGSDAGQGRAETKGTPAERANGENGDRTKSGKGKSGEKAGGENSSGANSSGSEKGNRGDQAGGNQGAQKNDGNKAEAGREGSDGKGAEGNGKLGNDPSALDKMGQDLTGDRKGPVGKEQDAPKQQSGGSTGGEGQKTPMTNETGKEGAGKEGAGKDGAGPNDVGTSQTGGQGAQGPKENQIGNEKGGSQPDGKNPNGSQMNGQEKQGGDRETPNPNGSKDGKGQDSVPEKGGSENVRRDSESEKQAGNGKAGAENSGSGKSQSGKEGAGKGNKGSEGSGNGEKSGGEKGGGEKGGNAPSVKPNGNPGEKGEKASNKEQGAGQGSGSEEGGEDGPQVAGEPSAAGSGMNKQGTAPKSSGTGVSKQSQGGEFGADRASVEYADRATDMMLEYIDRQKDQPDPELLKRLDWSADDLRQFAERWKRAKEQAKSDPSKRAELEETLRNLGLSGTGQKVNQLKDRNDGLRGMREEGGRLRPPESLREQFEAFRKAAGKLGK